MKSFFTTLALIIITGISVSQAQTVTDDWAFGFGFGFPRYYSANITAINSDYGFYLAIQRNFSEHVGLRFKGGYSHLEGQWNDASLNLINESTNLFTGDLDLMYYIVPCEPVSPYLFAGIGGNHKNITNGQPTSAGIPDHNGYGSQLNVGAGAEFKFDPSWSVVAEYGYHATNNSELDGTLAPGEVNGRDSYYTLSAGLNYFFGKGEPSKLCEPCQGITQRDMTDYNKIDDMITKHIPKEIVKEVYVDKYIKEISNDRLVLIGVNFAFDKSDLLPESYPVLDKAVILLNDKGNVNVEIQGYTDYIGTADYNQELSVERAKTVKAYLVSKGIVEARLTTVGYGKGNPVADNDTEEGRAMNRRIVFKIVK
jgi:outer membrane protein OmpA-like peptidoglycan-associated protein